MPGDIISAPVADRTTRDGTERGVTPTTVKTLSFAPACPKLVSPLKQLNKESVSDYSRAYVKL